MTHAGVLCSFRPSENHPESLDNKVKTEKRLRQLQEPVSALAYKRRRCRLPLWIHTILSFALQHFPAVL